MQLEQNPDKEIGIILHNNGEESHFKVRIFDSIFSLFNKLQKAQSLTISKLIYKNIILSNAFSFAFYGINDGSHIYAIPDTKNNLNDGTESIKHKNKDHLHYLNREQFRLLLKKKYGNNCNDDEIDNYFHNYHNPLIESEVAKLKDRFFLKIEGTIKCHRRFLRSFFQISEKLSSSNDSNKENSNKDIESSSE